MSSPETHVSLTRAGDVATVQFSTEGGAPNVFSSYVIGELGGHVADLETDATLRYVVFRGVGRTFVAGANIKEMAGYDDGQGRVFSEHGHHVFDAIEALPAITIAAINGHALGGGCEVALACDFRVMAATGRIGLPECRLGLIPGWGGTQRLPRLVGPAWARRLMFSGDALPAERAQQIGLVDEVVTDASALDAALQRWFELLKPGCPAAVRHIKHALRVGDETHQFALSFKTSEADEGMQAFIDKRTPPWAT
jgi:enoyl-CoA hydratase